MSDDGVVQALAAASRQNEPYLANVLATEAMNRMRRARAVFTYVGEGVLTVDAAARVTSLNPSASRLLGWPPKDVLGRDLHETVHRADEAGHDRPRQACRILEPLADGEVVESDETLVRRDGEALPVSLVSAPILREGTIDGAVVAFRDDRDRRRAAAERERLLQISGSRAAELGALIESIPDSVFLGDADGIRLANRATCRLLGCESVSEINERGPGFIQDLDTRDASTGRRLRPEDVAFVRALGGETVEQSIVIRRLSTRERVYLRCHAAPVRVDGRIEGAVSVNSDVTEQVESDRRMRAWLALVEAFYRAYDRLGEGLALLEGRRIAFANPAFRRMLEREGSDLPEFLEVVSPERREEARDRLRRLFEGETVEEKFEWPLIRGDGSRVHAELSVVPIEHGGGGAFVLVVRDVAQRAGAWRALLEAYGMLDASFRRAPVGVVCVDHGGWIARANDAFAAEVGMPAESLPGRAVEDVLTGLAGVVRHAFAAGRPLYDIEAEVGRPPRRARVHTASADDRTLEIVILEIDGRPCGFRSTG